MANSTVLDKLHASLDSRLRPEDIAELILASGEDFDRGERQLLERVVQSRPRWWYSSMSSDFARPTDASRQIAALARMTGGGFGVDAANPAELRVLIATVGASVGWTSGSDFKADRLTRAELKAVDSPWSKRQYNRLVRHLTRLHAKVERLDVELRKRELMLVGRSGLAADITAARFHADPAAACFVAYFVARKNMRREFSLSGKTNPMDEIADMLFKRLGDASDWWMVSRVHPTPQVIARLSVMEQGELLGRWSALMRGAASILESVWDPSVNRTTMIVQRGMDSSTWNTVAQAYNTARSGWMNALAATGALDLLDAACPGKVMRLMAADLAFWHRSSGSDVDPDTAVWAALPLPWQVLSGAESCGRDYVTETCERFGVDPIARGWIGPRAIGKVATFRPTPELVHGVSIADPVWAGLLRRAGVFSGKQIKDGYEGIAVPPDVVVSDLPSKTAAWPYL